MSCRSFYAGGPNRTTNSWTTGERIAPVECDRGRTVCTSARSARFHYFIFSHDRRRSRLIAAGRFPDQKFANGYLHYKQVVAPDKISLCSRSRPKLIANNSWTINARERGCKKSPRNYNPDPLLSLVSSAADRKREDWFPRRGAIIKISLKSETCLRRNRVLSARIRIHRFSDAGSKG